MVFLLEELSAVILAAGAGTRMKSQKPKVLHAVCGKPLIDWVCDSVKQAGITNSIVVVGHKANEVMEYMGKTVQFVLQEKQLGTGHAVMQARSVLENKKGHVIILNGDTPLITSDTIHKVIRYHLKNDNAVTIITTETEDPTGYGRIVRNHNNQVTKIVEHKDASAEEKQIKEINSGIYCFKIQDLLDSLCKMNNNNSQKEYYLTDTIEILIQEQAKVEAFKIQNSTELLGINNRIQLSQVEKIMQRRILWEHMQNGVTIIDPENTYIQSKVHIKCDTVIYPGCIIESGTQIGENCIIGPYSRIVNSIIGDYVEIQNSVIFDSHISSNTCIGPFAYLRPGSKIGSHVKIGDFVEIKNSTIGDGTKVSHLTYIGDAEVGKNVNMGCGSVIVNYDGKKKHKTIIGDNSFVGCNVNLVSPVIVNKGAYIAAGSTITEEVPEDSLAIARQRQTIKEGWVNKKFKFDHNMK